MRRRALTDEQRQRFRQSAMHGHKVVAEVIRFCYTWSGTEGLRNPSVLGRCLRDMQAATRHVFVDPITLVDAGPALLESWLLA